MRNPTARALEAIERIWPLLAEANDGETASVDGATAVATGGDIPPCNQALVHSASSDPASTIARLVEWFDARRLPFVIQVLEGLDGMAGAAAAELRELMRTPLMVAATSAVTATRPDGVRIEPVYDDASIASNVAMSSAGFAMPEGPAHIFMNARIARHPDCAAFNAVLDGEVVGTATMIASEGAAGIFSVTAAEHVRRRGVGAAITAAAVRAGLERGCDLAYLQSSEMGLGVYERLGFRTVASCTVYGR